MRWASNIDSNYVMNKDDWQAERATYGWSHIGELAVKNV
jgi:hypothetical protein